MKYFSITVTDILFIDVNKVFSYCKKLLNTTRITILRKY